jgi:hypothetical protein
MASTVGARQAGATTLTQQSENFGYSAVRLRRIVRLQFGVVNPAELVRLYRFLLGMVNVLRLNEYSIALFGQSLSLLLYHGCLLDICSANTV